MCVCVYTVEHGALDCGILLLVLSLASANGAKQWCSVLINLACRFAVESSNFSVTFIFDAMNFILKIHWHV